MSGFLGAIGAALPDIGGAIGDLLGSEGSGKEAQAYANAAKLSLEDVNLQKMATRVQTYQQQRAEYGVLGQERAAVTANGFAATSGTAADIMRASASQGSLATQMVGLQGLINETGYQQQAQSYEAAASAAKQAQQGGLFGGIGKLFSAGIAMAGFL